MVADVEEDEEAVAGIEAHPMASEEELKVAEGAARAEEAGRGVAEKG